MKSLIIRAILPIIVTQAVPGLAVLRQGPFVGGPFMGHGPVVHTTGEPDDNPVWNSKSLATTGRVQLRITNNVTTNSNFTSADMGPMGSMDFQCGICKLSRNGSCISSLTVRSRRPGIPTGINSGPACLYTSNKPSESTFRRIGIE